MHFIRIKDEKLCFYVQFFIRTHYEKVDNLDRITWNLGLKSRNVYHKLSKKTGNDIKRNYLTKWIDLPLWQIATYLYTIISIIELSIFKLFGHSDHITIEWQKAKCHFWVDSFFGEWRHYSRTTVVPEFWSTSRKCFCWHFQASFGDFHPQFYG